jgi:hypothetical protein
MGISQKDQLPEDPSFWKTHFLFWGVREWGRREELVVVVVVAAAKSASDHQ